MNLPSYYPKPTIPLYYASFLGIKDLLSLKANLSVFALGSYLSLLKAFTPSAIFYLSCIITLLLANGKSPL